MTDVLPQPVPAPRQPASPCGSPRRGAGSSSADGDAFRSLYREHAGALLAYAEHFTHDRMAAEDALQETFLRAWRHLPGLLDDDRPARPWLRTVLRRILIDAARVTRGRTIRLIEDAVLDGATDGGFDAVLDREVLDGAMEQLSPPHREVLEGIYYCDLPAERLAVRLGVPVGTVRSRLHYALNALRGELTRMTADAVPQVAW